MKQKLTELLNIKKEAIWIKSNKEKETLPFIINILIENNIETIYTWSILKTVEKIKIENRSYIKERLEESISSPVAFLEFYETLQKDVNKENTAFIFRDYDDCIDTNHMYKRMIKEITEKKNNIYIPIIFISNRFDIPADLVDIFSLVESKAPNKEDIIKLLNMYENNRKKIIDNKEEIVNYLYGFYYQEIIEILDTSFYKYNEINLSVLKEKRVELINKTNLLSYEIPTVTIDDIGGNKRFKDWYKETKYCFNKDAQEYGVEPPKGYLALGIPGCSKTLAAKAIANDLNLPFLMLDMSKLLSCRVGESEQRIARAIELIETCSPCVLLIDEVEKNIGGVNSSNNSDSGVVARVFGKILEMLNDNNKGIYVVMTSNNVQDLPPELTRAGRLDAIWYFSLPTEKERADILNIHFKKRGYELSNKVLNEAAKYTKGFTGAELEQIVKTTIKKGYVNKIKNNLDDITITSLEIKEAQKDVVPISKSSKEKILSLENWAKGRALFANEKEEIDINKVLENITLEEVL